MGKEHDATCSGHVSITRITTPTRGASRVSNEEEPAPSAPGSEIGNDDAASDAEQASSAHKRRKTGLTKLDDEYTVSKRREALTAKANTGKFTGLRVETPAKRNSAKTAKHVGKDFVYGVLFITLLAFGAKTPVNCTAKCFCCCTSDCEYFFDLTGAEGKDCSKTSTESTRNLVVIDTFSNMIVL